MTASEYVVGRGAVWTVEAARRAGASDTAITEAIDRIEAALTCDRQWLANRLTVMWLASGYRRDEAAATAWLHEYMRLLGDIPTDILAAAIDECVRRSDRGFLPAVGAIVREAEPHVARRRDALRRLRLLEKPEVLALPAPVADGDVEWTPDAIRDLGQYARLGAKSGWFTWEALDAAFAETATPVDSEQSPA